MPEDILYSLRMFTLIGYSDLAGFKLSETMFAVVIFLLSCSEYVFSQDMPDIDITVPFWILDDPPVPSEEDLNYACPGIMEALEYYRIQSQKNPDSFTDDQHIYMATTGEFLRDMCTNTSQLRQNYGASYQCFKDIDEEVYTCTDAIKPLYEQWKAAHPKDDPQITLKCFLRRFSEGCLARRIKEACGDLAYSTYMEVTERSSYLSERCGPNFVNMSTLDSDYAKLLNLAKNNGTLNQNATDTSIE